MKYQKRASGWKYQYTPEANVLLALELAAAFVGMHTDGGVPKEYVGEFDALLEDPKWALRMIMVAIESMKGK